MGVSWDGQFDLSFIWAGVNDIVFNVDWSAPLSDDSVKRPWAELIMDLSGFYGSMLDDVLMTSKRVVTVPPLFVGEETNNIFSKVLEVIAVDIERLTVQYEDAEYLDLRSIVKSELEGKDRPGAPVGAINEDSEDRSAPLKPIAGNALWQGILHYTIDGIHLNDAGARLVAKAFLEKIKSISEELD
jgi:lysophospholipase L1-like esterase